MMKEELDQFIKELYGDKCNLGEKIPTSQDDVLMFISLTMEKKYYGIRLFFKFYDSYEIQCTK